MSTSSNLSLGAIREQAKFRADLENNSFVSTYEWNSYISNSYKRLYNMLVAAYGDDWFVAPYYQFNLTSSQTYPFPDGTPVYQSVTGTTAPKFWKLLGVDIQYSSSPTGWVTLRRFETITRNRNSFPNTAVTYNGWLNLRYRPQGDNLWFDVVPMGGQTARLLYIPAPTSLQFILSCGQTQGSPTLTLPDTTNLTAGMNVAAGTGIADGTTILSLSSTSVTMTTNAQATLTSNTLFFWDDSTTLDGISGFDEFVIIDAAIKASIKEEDDINPLVMQRQDMVNEIEALANGRDAGQAQHVSDVLGANSAGGSTYDGGYGGWGMGDY